MESVGNNFSVLGTLIILSHFHKFRLATNLENIENLENSGSLKNCQYLRENSRKF